MRRESHVRFYERPGVKLPWATHLVVLVSGTQEDAVAEQSALADYLRRTTGLELSPAKTKVTAMTDGFEFLGFRFGMHWDKRYGYGPRVEVPKGKAAILRHKVKQLTRSDSISGSLGEKLRELNPILSGWANYYRHCVGAGRVFVNLDWYVGLRLYCWLRRKRPKARAPELWGLKQPSSRRPTRRLWRDGSAEQHLLGWTSVCRYRLAWMRTPDFATPSGEPDA